MDTIQKIQFILKIMSMQAISAARAGANDNNKLLEGFCKSFFESVWEIEYPLPTNSSCNQPVIDYVTLGDELAFQVTTRNDFNTKCKECINGFEDKKLFKKHNRLVIVFFRNLTEKEERQKKGYSSSYFRFNSKEDILALEDLLKIIYQCNHDTIDKIYKLCQNYCYIDFDNLSFYESRNESICEDYIPRSIRIVESKVGDIQGSLKEYVLKNDRVILLADAATGKTQELKKLSNDIKSNGYVPYLFQLKNYNGKEIGCLLPNNFLMNYSPILILDGYEEIRPEFIDTFEREMNIFSSQNTNVKIIISSRLNFYDKNGGPLDNYIKILLNDLTDYDIMKYFAIKLGENANENIRLCKDRNIYDLLLNPFYLINVVKALAEGKSFSNKIELMDSLFDIAYEDFYKKTNSAINKKEILMSLCKIALFVLEKGQTIISENEVNIEDLNLIKSFQWITYEDGKIGFLHNNFKEYLAAVELSTKDLTDIKQIISIEIIKPYIRPQFYNALGFLMDIKSEDSSLREFLLENGKSFLISMERVQLSNTDKLAIVTSIFDEYNEKKSWMNSALYSEEKIAKLCDSLALIKFLISRIDKKYHRTNIISAFNVLKNIENLYGKENTIKDRLLEWLEEKEILADQYMLSQIIYFMNSLKPSIELVKKLYQRFSVYPKSSVRAAANYLIYKNRLGKYFVKELVEGKNRSKIKAYFVGHDDIDDIIDGGESFYISLAIKDIGDQDALSELGNYILEEEKKHNNLHIIEDYYEIINKLNSFNNSMVALIFKMLTGIASYYFRSHTKNILSLIEKHNLRKLYFYWIVESDIETYYKTDLFALIIDKEIETDLIKELAKEDYKDYRNRFITNLSQSYDNWKQVKNQLNDNGSVCDVIVYNYEERQKEFLQKSYDKLFSIDEILQEVKRIFTILNKDELTWHEICSIGYDIDEKIPHFAKSCFISAKEDEKLTYDDIKSFINETWQISHIYESAKNDKVNTTEMQKGFIVNWCIKTLPQIDFSSAISYKENGYSTSYLAIWAEFFIRNFDIKVEKSIFTDMLCFCWGSHSSNDFSQLEWLESKLGSKTIKLELKKHIDNNRIKNFILINRLEYCIMKKWDIALSYVIKELENFQDVNEDMYYHYINYISEIGKIEDLLCFYDNFNNKFKGLLIDKFLEKDNRTITKYCEKDILDDNDDSIILAEKLIGLKSQVALQYYIKWTKSNGKFFNNDGFNHPDLSVFNDIKYLDDLIELLELTYLYKSRYDVVRPEVNNILSAISLASLPNLKRVVVKLESFITQSRHVDVSYQYYYIDKMINSFIMQSNVI